MYVIIGLITCIIVATMFILHCEKVFSEVGMMDYILGAFIGMFVGAVWPAVIPLAIIVLTVKTIVKVIKSEPKQREGMSRNV